MRDRHTRIATLLVAMLCAGAALPRPGGVVRVWIPGAPGAPVPDGLASTADVLLSSSVFRGLVQVAADGTVRPDLALSWVPPRDADDGWVFQLDPLARFPDGRRVSAADVIRSWTALLRSERAPSLWLLDPVRGARRYTRGEAEEVEGLVDRGDMLEIRVNGSTPDLLLRLAHPALGVFGYRSNGGDVIGAGPFSEDWSQARIGANPFHRSGPPYLDGFMLVEATGVDPSLLLEAREADLAMLYGRSVGPLLTTTPPGIQLRRAPSWDRRYALVWNPRPLADEPRSGLPWELEQSLNREKMIRFLFDGRGAEIYSLLDAASADEAVPSWRDVNLHARRVHILFDEEDPYAAAIASRLKAVWEDLRVPILLRGLEPALLTDRLMDGEFKAAVVRYQPPATDPVLSLWETVAAIGPVGLPALDSLREASRSHDPVERRRGALAAERILLQSGVLVPLVRLDAWMAADARLVGVRPGPAGLLRLDDAWWLPTDGMVAEAPEP